MKPFATIAALVVAVFGVYALYMVLQAQRVPERLDISASISFKDAPPMVCDAGNDAHTVGGKIYVFNDTARFDINSSANGVITLVHIIVNREGTGYMWIEGNTIGSFGDYEKVYSIVGLRALTQITCSAWWVPDGAQFIVPQGVTFSQRL